MIDGCTSPISEYFAKLINIKRIALSLYVSAICRSIDFTAVSDSLFILIPSTNGFCVNTFDEKKIAIDSEKGAYTHAFTSCADQSGRILFLYAITRCSYDLIIQPWFFLEFALKALKATSFFLHITNIILFFILMTDNGVNRVRV